MKTKYYWEVGSKTVLKTCKNGKHIRIFSSVENSYLAAKVSLFNEFYQLTEKVGCNWDNVVNGLTLDKRIEKDHTQVPGPDGQFGWGGHCFPKDTAALVDIGDKYGVNLLTLEAARKSNSKIRK